MLTSRGNYILQAFLIIFCLSTLVYMNRHLIRHYSLFGESWIAERPDDEAIEGTTEEIRASWRVCRGNEITDYINNHIDDREIIYGLDGNHSLCIENPKIPFSVNAYYFQDNSLVALLTYWKENSIRYVFQYSWIYPEPDRMKAALVLLKKFGDSEKYKRAFEHDKNFWSYQNSLMSSLPKIGHKLMTGRDGDLWELDLDKLNVILDQIVGET